MAMWIIGGHLTCLRLALKSVCVMAMWIIGGHLTCLSLALKSVCVMAKSIRMSAGDVGIPPAAAKFVR